MAEMGVVTAFDRAVLAAYCQAYGRWAEAERKLAETPLLIKLPNGAIQQSPWLAIANKQLELLHKFMGELGLSPVSRSRVEVKSRHPKPWEFGLRPGEKSKFDGLLGARDWSQDESETDEFFR